MKAFARAEASSSFLCNTAKFQVSELSACLSIFLRFRRTSTIFCCFCFESKVREEQTVLLNAIFWQNSEQPRYLSEEPDIQMNLV